MHLPGAHFAKSAEKQLPVYVLVSTGIKADVEVI